MTILYFILSLGVLIFIHEIGHFIMAKRAGICVEVFSLGFGPKLLGFRIGETEYRISALPLGGYVKMLGEEPGEDKGLDPRSYSAKSVWARARVVLCGPLMNLILCFALMPVVFMIGRSEPAFLSESPRIAGVKADTPAERAGMAPGDLIVAVDGSPVAAWDDVLSRVLISPDSILEFEIERDGALSLVEVQIEQLPEMKGGFVGVEPMLFLGGDPVIDSVQSGAPADMAGIVPGDRVVQFGGRPVEDWLALTRMVNDSGGRRTGIVVERGGELVAAELSASYSEDYGRWVIGVTKDRSSGVPMTMVRYGFFDAIRRGAKENVKLASMTMRVLYRLVTFQLSYKVLGGPIIIAKTSAAAAASGFSNFLYFIAFLSLQLGILNLLPIPVLDGGQVVFLGIEGVMGRPLSVRFRAAAQHVGFFILIALMLLVTINDIDSVWGLRSLFGRIF